MIIVRPKLMSVVLGVALILFLAASLINAQTPTPILNSLSPNSTTAGGPSFSLTVTGANFNPSSVVLWNGSNRTTTFVSNNVLLADIPATDIVSTGVANITVIHLGSTQPPSNTLSMTIGPAANPPPVLNNLSPNVATAGGAGFNLIAQGTNFIPGSIIRWNGIDRPTVFHSAGQLSTMISADDISGPGVASVTVFTRGPGGGSSNVVPFAVNPPDNPVPAITSLSPNSALVGTSSTSIIITGSNFGLQSIVRWNGMDLPTTFISATQLMTTVPSFQLTNLGTFSVSVFNPAPGGGTSNSLAFVVSVPTNPVPVLNSVNPNTAVVGGPGINLTIMGSNFNSASIVRWNNQDRQTMFISGNQLMAIIPSSDFAVASSANVTVFNPAPGGGSSNALQLAIQAAPNPVPVILNISPTTTTAGNQGFTLVVNGSGFNMNSQVRWNGTTRPTMFISASQLTAMVPANDIASAGQATVTVFNDGPGGGTSNALSATILPAPAPVLTLTSLSPDSVVAGASGFSLTVTGQGFTPTSIVRWNGSDRPTSFISASQLSASISATDIATNGTANVTVFSGTSGGTSTNSLLFMTTIRPLAPPTLSSISVDQVAQGTRHLPLILVGTNFRPGARVVISETALRSSPAVDLIVESVTHMSDTTILVNINVNDRAVATTRLVDVINTDNSNTGTDGSRTSQRLQVVSATSLAAPLAVHDLVITNPHNGGVVAQGDEIYPEAILAGVGTGTITGQWLWDGNIIEQFFVTFTGGQNANVKGVNPLPTVFLGLHTLELRITSPNTFVSKPFKVIINPGSWKQIRLIAPGPGIGYRSNGLPLLRWSIVAGAERYQVGFSTEPFFSKISHWYDVQDTQWQVPDQIWSQLPEGELYWTVRPMELGRTTSNPAPMRRLLKVASGALMADPKQPASLTSEMLLKWLALATKAIYRVTLMVDPEGKHVLRKAFTTDSFFNFRDTRGQLQAGKTYYWQVEAFSPTGHLIFVGGRQSFVAGPESVAAKNVRTDSKHSDLLRANNDALYKKASLTEAPRPKLYALEETPLLRTRAPEPKQVVHHTRPLISIEFRARVTQSNLTILLDNTEITTAAQVTERKVTVRPLVPLANGTHVVEVSAGSQTESWEFVVTREEVKTTSISQASQTDAEAETETSPDPIPSKNQEGSQSAEANNRQLNYELSSHSQWVSGNEVDNNLSSLAAQASIKHGPWRAEVSGTGLVNSLFSTKPKHALGQFNDYVMRLAHDRKGWGADLRFGTIAPQSFTGAEFMTTSYPRQAVEAAVRTPGGIVTIYSNAFEKGGEGQGDAFAFRQDVNGGSYQAPLLSERVGFRFTWLSARDIGAAPFNVDSNENFPGFGGRKSGASFDALFTLRVGKTWRLTSEYSFASNNLNEDLPSQDHHSGRAWRTAMSGNLGRTMINFSFRNVSPDFANPVTASLGQLSTADRRGVDASFVSPTSVGMFNVSYQLLQSDVHSRERRPITLNNLNWNWGKNLTSTTVVTVGGNLSRTASGDQPQAAIIPTFETDQSRFALNSTVRQTVGRLTLTLGGSRNWFVDGNNKRMNNVSSALNLAGQLQLGSFFQLQTNFSVNWLHGDKFSFGETRSMSAYIQPVLSWNRMGLRLSPLVAINKIKATLGYDIRMSDMLNAQYGGRLSWQMPGRLRFSTLSFEGTQSIASNRIQATEITTPRLLVVWTLIHGSKQKE